MKLVIYENYREKAATTSIKEWSDEADSNFPQTFLKPGTILFIKKSDVPRLMNNLGGIKFVKCETKEKHIELFRTLRFHVKKDIDVPRLLHVDYLTVSSFKKSIFPFLSKRHDSSYPACILVVPDMIIDNFPLEDFRETDCKHNERENIDMFSLFFESTKNDKNLKKISETFLGSHPDIKLVHSMICKAAKVKSPLLILGETGTGKEVIADLVFKNQTEYKKGDKLHVINCAAIPDDLLESELFGHVKGAFTGAGKDKQGLFKVADKGTIFLDEIGDLSLRNQIKVLRAIEFGEIRPVGSTDTQKVDCRVISATNRDLHSMMKQEKFREDLYYRLSEFIIYTPPLREHPEDIPLIARFFWKNLKTSVNLTDEFLNYLLDYSWPGNARELKALLTSMSDMFPGETLMPKHIDALKSYRNKIMKNSVNQSEPESDKQLKTDSRIRMIEVQKIVRAIKIELRPIINYKGKNIDIKTQKGMKVFIFLKTGQLEQLCSEPIYFRNKELLDTVARFRYELEKMLDIWESAKNNHLNELQFLWINNMQSLYNIILNSINDMIWKRIDL